MKKNIVKNLQILTKKNKNNTLDKISPSCLQQAMQSEDQELAKMLLSLHQGIREMKLQRCCEKNREVLDEAIEITDDPATRITDSLPQTLSSRLKDVGLTKMNIKGRRFSVL